MEATLDELCERLEALPLTSPARAPLIIQIRRIEDVLLAAEPV